MAVIVIEDRASVFKGYELYNLIDTNTLNGIDNRKQRQQQKELDSFGIGWWMKVSIKDAG